MVSTQQITIIIVALSKAMIKVIALLPLLYASILARHLVPVLT